MFLCITKKKPCFWSFENCETGAGGWSQVDKWSQVDRWSLVAGGHSEKIQKGWLAIAKLKPLSLFISPF